MLFGFDCSGVGMGSLIEYFAAQNANALCQKILFMASEIVI